jgi:hypothetical protein
VDFAGPRDALSRVTRARSVETRLYSAETNDAWACLAGSCRSAAPPPPRVTSIAQPLDYARPRSAGLMRPRPGTHWVPKPPVIGVDFRDCRRAAVERESPCLQAVLRAVAAEGRCLPCRRSRVRIPSAACEWPAFASLFVHGWCDKTSTPPRLSDSAVREQDDEDLAVPACGRPDGVGGDDRLVAT